MTLTTEQVAQAFGLSLDNAVYVAQGLNLGLGVLTALVIFAIGWMISKWAYSAAVRTVQRRELDAALGNFLASMLQWTVLAAAGIAALEAVGMETTSLVAVFASAGIAVGLALQGSLSNFASGVMLLVFRPFTLNDVVETGGTTGAVHEIGLFATVLITPDNRKVIVPNSSVAGGTVINLTTLGTRRADVPVGVAYGEDPTHVAALLKKAAESCPAVKSDPEVGVAFVGLGASSIDFSVRGWCAAADYFVASGQIRHACYSALNEAGIDIPYNQIVVHQASAEA